MEAQCKKEQHFKVECKIDGIWFNDAFVFPDRGTANAFKLWEEVHGSGNSYRVVVTDAPVNLPPADLEKEEGASGDGSSDEDGPPSGFDWSSFFDLIVLCPASVYKAGDGDLERIYDQCCQGCSVVGEVFI